MARWQNSPIYAVGERFVDIALRRDDSLFTPGTPIWSPANLDELNTHYVQNPDLGSGSFEDKLRQQLEGASPAAMQLMAEALFVYYLPARWNISGAVKRQKIEEVLAWIPGGPKLPADLSVILDTGVGSGGPGFHLYKWASLAFTLVFVRQWKQAPASVRDEALADPWKFHAFLSQIPTEGGGIYGRESLLHLLFPDTFERVFSGSAKVQLADILKALVDDPAANVDVRLAQIRAKLEKRFGKDFDFYDTDGVRALWRRFDDPLNEFIYWASRFHELANFVPDERTYKLEIVGRLTDARSALLEGGDWFPLLKRAFTTRNNLTNWQSHDAFLKWLEADLVGGAKALRRIWDAGDDALNALGDFLSHLPNEAVNGRGSRTTLGSFLMFALDPYAYPPYRTAALHAAYHLAKFDPGEEGSEVAMYRAALDFFDRVKERAEERGLKLADRLDAQSVAWSITSWDVPAEWPEEDRVAFERYRKGIPDDAEDEVADEGHEEEPHEPADVVDPLIALADELLIEHRALRAIADLLNDKRQLVIYGPPGTGKTYAARKLARALAGDASRVELVQFHPSYAYEDFIEGYRPGLEDGQATFKLVGGPFKRLAERALVDPGKLYFLIIDELNRGNVAKVFGELYFLLEYRDEPIHLQYSQADFRLPPNLRIIGTMNTADRSIALLDAALRRRFAFVPFFPDKPPIQGLLGRWLNRHRSEMAWVAPLVDRANAILNDRNAAIGPSYFMHKDLSEERLATIWAHEIVPLVEDHLFDAPERVREFDLGKLRGDKVSEALEPTVSAIEPPALEDLPVPQAEPAEGDVDPPPA